MNPNDVLLWFSAKGSGSWGRYRAAVDELQMSEDPNGNEEDLNEDVRDSSSLPIHHRLRLNLERLGHAEFFRKDFQNGWRVVPPTLACGDNEEEVIGILCGARSDRLLARIKGMAANLRITVTSQAECPDRIAIMAEDEGRLEQLAISTSLHFQPRAARMLLAAVPPVDDRQLRTPAELPFGDDWEVHRFSTDALGWTSTMADDARSASFGLFRFQMAYQPQYYIRLRGRGYKIPVQVGKYLVLRRRRRRVVAYDADNQSLSVPVSCRPPLLVDRALTLCSGLIPRIESRRLVYQNVSKAIAFTTSGLLRQ